MYIPSELFSTDSEYDLMVWNMLFIKINTAILNSLTGKFENVKIQVVWNLRMCLDRFENDITIKKRRKTVWYLNYSYFSMCDWIFCYGI